MKNKRITFIGCGNMGSNLIGGLLASGYDRKLITGCEPDPSQRAKVIKRHDIEIFADNKGFLPSADIVVLAVKPQIMEEVCVGMSLALSSQILVISTAAGIELTALGRWLGENRAIVRVMPNTPALVKTGASALVANTHTSNAQKRQADIILQSVGTTLWLEKESLINTVTAVSGSGPAYFFLVMEAMCKAGENLGLSTKQAKLLTVQTALGAARMALGSELEIEQLRQQVTSPGGTTERAVKVLTEADIEQIFSAAIEAASNRSAELAKIYAGKKPT